MKKTIALTAGVSCVLTILALWAAGWAPPVSSSVKLENAKVKVSQVVYNPGSPRARFVRPYDQVVVFMDDCRYERTDSQTKAKEIRERKSGDVIWHDKGEDAPQLINLGAKPFRTTVIEVK